MSLADIKNYDLYYESRGSGEPLLLIPGFASGAWNWFCQIEELSKDFRVITFDPRGIGKSNANEADLRNLSMQTFIEDVRAILDDLKIEKANVLGASFGGFVAQEFVFAFPERVNKLILACTTAGGANHVKPDIEILRSFAPDPSLPISEKIRRFIRPAFTEEFNEQNAAEVERVCQMREHVAFSLDTESKLGAIKNETLIISGNKDKVVPMENSLNLAKNLPNANLKIIENGSHLFFIENADQFNRAIKNFLKGESV
jgi:pimeloyl-ACP methyl ester carboxylesterase